MQPQRALEVGLGAELALRVGLSQLPLQTGTLGIPWYTLHSNAYYQDSSYGPNISMLIYNILQDITILIYINIVCYNTMLIYGIYSYIYIYIYSFIGCARSCMPELQKLAQGRIQMPSGWFPMGKEFFAVAVPWQGKLVHIP